MGTCPSCGPFSLVIQPRVTRADAGQTLVRNSLWRWGLALRPAVCPDQRRPPSGVSPGWLSAYRATLPVVVVGNPRWGQRQDPVVVWLVEQLQARAGALAWSAAAMAARRPITPIDWMSSTPAEAGMSPCSSQGAAAAPWRWPPDGPMRCGCWSKAVRWTSSSPTTACSTMPWPVTSNWWWWTVRAALAMAVCCPWGRCASHDPPQAGGRHHLQRRRTRPWRVRHAPGAGYPAPGVRRCASHGPSRGRWMPWRASAIPRFFATLTALGYELVQSVGYGDHQAFDAAELLARFASAPC